MRQGSGFYRIVCVCLEAVKAKTKGVVMKKLALLVVCVFMVALVAGCAQKSETQQLKEDMNKAGKKLSNELQGLTK